MPKNIVFVSHCNFQGNSAMHLFSIANVLTDLGHSCAICAPESPETALAHGQPRFQVLDYDAAERHGISFSNGEPPALVHAWTPREHVRKLTMSLVRRYDVPYFVHLEDNEIAVLLDRLPGKTLERLRRLPIGVVDGIVGSYLTHPLRAEQLLDQATGVTALIDRLLEFKPQHVPGLVFFPGHDTEFAEIDGRAEDFRSGLGIAADELVVAYTGNVHESNFREVRSLVLAIVIANRRGCRVKLLKTGWNHYRLPELSDPEIAPLIIDLGFIPRADVCQLLAAADVLIQPGRSDEFNDYRFPSKLPEFLASGRPVILPRTNIGLLLKDGEEAVVLEHGHSVDIAAALQRLAKDPRLREKIGNNGRKFALQHLAWGKNSAALREFYDHCLAQPRPVAKCSVVSDRIVPKLIAFYLPQFHPIPENDKWWGKGFTEWTNVAAARPNFVGHVQPRLPADLGFYDLRLPETIDAQVALASRYGVYGFCFHYYWFDGRRLLDRPLNQFLERGRPDFPFCISWANENWTRRWDGQENDVLLRQEYGPDFAMKFIRDVIPILNDPRYIKVDGAPILLVYRITELPDPCGTAEIWRDECRKAGIPTLHLAVVQSGIADPRPFGFDAAVEFPPHTNRFLLDPKGYPGVDPAFRGYLEDYQRVAANQLEKPLPEFTLYRGVMPSWDNTPRRKGHSHILVNATPELYLTWLRGVTAQTMALAETQEPLVFINAWNEWAEGAILEPDATNGHAFLEATRAGLALGMADCLQRQGIDVRGLPASELGIGVEAELSSAEFAQPKVQRPRKTGPWFSDQELEVLSAKYRSFEIAPLSYGTVRDFRDSYDHLQPIATFNGDLKDSQRPWTLKALLSLVPRGGRVLEIGAGEPLVADLLDRMGYEVWVVDPYDGTGNGPVEYERFRQECPNLRFVRVLFGEQLLSAPPSGFDCIYSISVLEHVPRELLGGVFRGMKKYLRSGGWSIHTVDHVHRGKGAAEHYSALKSMITWSGHEEAELVDLLARMEADVETYYLSAESHNRWRGSLSYDEFPMRACVSVQLASPAAQLTPLPDQNDLADIGERGD
jgi:glycosyltransferase involved in cell wall biosynthesis